MKKYKVFIVLSVIVIAVFIIAFVVGNSVTNVCEYYVANVDVSEEGNITVRETVVINYKSYHNYILRDIKYNKQDYSQEPYNKYGYQEYQNDTATFDESSVSVRVYRGNVLSDDGDYQDITSTVNIGYSYDNGYYNTESGVCDTECERGSGKCVCISVDAFHAGTLTGVMSFEYTYTILDMATKYSDCSELNYKLFEYMGMTVKNAAVTINLPTAVRNTDDLYAYGHGLAQGEVRIFGANQIDYLAKNVKDTEEFECRVIFPNEVLTDVSITDSNYVDVNIKEDILSYERALAEETKTLYIIVTVLNIVTFGIIALMIFITIRVYKKYDKEFIASFDKEYLRELPSDYPPAIMSYLYYFGKNNDEDVTATLLDLVRRGYLELEAAGDINDKNPDFTIRIVSSKLEEMENKLLPHEKQLISWFVKVIGDGEKVTIKQIESYGKNYTQAQKFNACGVEFNKKIKEKAKGYDFFINTMKDKSVAASYGLIPIIFIIILYLVGLVYNITFTWNIIVCVVIVLIYSAYVATIKKRSMNGNEEYAKWKAFKKFLEDFGSFEDYPMPGIVIWEHYLVYATSFKIADKVMEQLKVKLPEIPEGGTYLSNRYYSGPNFYFYTSFNRINHSISTAKKNTISSIAQHNASKVNSGGRGGGFSGGSSFGGGGGGFRGGR